MSPSGIMTVFITQGTLIGVIGTLIGAVLGVLTAINIEWLVPFVERSLGVEFFPGDIYVISDFPAELHVDDVVRIVVMALVLSLVATLYPAWKASRTQPAQALRYD
jgi:lipoprotein-releasing system permease protein